MTQDTAGNHTASDRDNDILDAEDDGDDNDIDDYDDNDNDDYNDNYNDDDAEDEDDDDL